VLEQFRPQMNADKHRLKTFWPGLFIRIYLRSSAADFR